MISSNMSDAQIFAGILAKARTVADRSQESMSLAMGVSKATIGNWEKGTSVPNMNQTLRWFKECNLNPFPYMLRYVFPESFTRSSNAPEDMRKSLHAYIDSMPDEMLEQLCYIAFGQHGSSSFSVIQMMSAHLHADMKSRVAQARLVKENYEMCMVTNTLTCPNEALPDMAILEDGIVQGKKAVGSGANGYSVNQK